MNNTSSSNFTPSTLPKELSKASFKVKKGREGSNGWRLVGKLDVEGFSELFQVVDVSSEGCAEGNRRIRVFSPLLDRWMAENGFYTAFCLDEGLSEDTRTISEIKFGEGSCGSGTVWDVGCLETTSFFGLVTRYRFDVELFGRR